VIGGRHRSHEKPIHIEPKAGYHAASENAIAFEWGQFILSGHEPQKLHSLGSWINNPILLNARGLI
jgi:hypothetical protein